MNNHSPPQKKQRVVIIGGGSAGVSVASSLRKRTSKIDIVIIDPATQHYYQPGWTMVGGGVFTSDATVKPMANVIPDRVRWIRASVTSLRPAHNEVILNDGDVLTYDELIICPGLVLNWAEIDGLTEALGKNGVTSNYRFDLAPYTWKQIQALKKGKALFTQPPMPIKCAGAPQKAMYLACDYWNKAGRQPRNKTQFHTAGNAIFSVSEYVPALMKYVEHYEIELHFQNQLVAVDGTQKTATFRRLGGDKSSEMITEEFDMLHAVPPQTAPEFIRSSILSDEAGWLSVDPFSLRHTTFSNVHGLGDVINTSNAKTMAAARKQAPVVANNVLSNLGYGNQPAAYDGYGSCPLTVERGKIVLAEFTYGGKLAPSFPSWLLEGREPTRLAWQLKANFLPSFYWHGMLKGREWLAKPKKA